MGESYNGIRALADLFAFVKIPNTPDVSEPLDVVRDRLVDPLSDLCQVCELHLMYSCEEVLVELLLQISPCNDGVGW